MFLVILKQVLINLFIPLATKTIMEYIKNSESKQDDKILEVAKLSINYLAENSNNTVSKEISKALNDCSIISNCQKAKD